MPPTATTQSEWVGLTETSFLSQIITNTGKSLYARQNSESPSPTRFQGPTNTIFPPPNSSGPPPPDSTRFHIIGLSRSIFIVVIVVGVVVLTVICFVAVCCFKRWKRNRPATEHMFSVQMQDIDHISHFGDAPRPDSTALPMQNALQSKSEGTLPHVDGNVGSPLGTMLNRFSSPSGSASHRRLGSGDSTYSSRVTWDNDHTTRATSRTMPSAPGPSSPVPFSAYRSPSITPLESNPPRAPPSTRGKRPFRDTIISVSRPLSISNKLRRKTENRAVSEPALRAPVATTAGFGRVSAGSMSNWVSWWESSSDEEEEEATTKRKKRKK